MKPITASQIRDRQAQLADTSVGGVAKATNLIEALQTFPVDKSVGGQQRAQETLILLSGGSIRDTSPSGEQQARRIIAAQDPLGERQLPIIHDAHRQIADGSVGSTQDAAEVVSIAQGAHLRDTSIRGHNRAREDLVSEALAFLQ